MSEGIPNERVRIVVPGDDPPHIAGTGHLDRLAPYGDVTLYRDRPASIEEQLDRVRGADVILNTRSAVHWREAQLRQLPRLRLISTCSVGTDGIDLEAARALGITVCHQAGNTAPIVAEHQFALMLGVAKRLAFQTAELKAGRWQAGWNMTMRGKTLGIVGAGTSGAEMARLSRALGMDVVAWTFHPSEERARALGVRFVSFEELLSTADVVSLHVALSSETRHLVDAAALAQMKPGAILVNGARGAVVDTDALVEALRSGHLAGAGLDVFEQEPLPADSPLLTLDPPADAGIPGREVVLTPHAADATPEGMDYLNRDAVDHIIAYLEGRPEGVAN